MEPQAASQRNINIPLIRYSDVLLMYAETENYLNNGPTPEAEAALKEVRTRAGVGELPIQPISKVLRMRLCRNVSGNLRANLLFVVI